MGRVRTALIKRTAEKLIKNYEFKDNFGENKKILGITMPSKRMRNMIAGYVTKLVKTANAKQNQKA